jgi:purine-binding chemotaxis protein CheW
VTEEVIQPDPDQPAEAAVEVVELPAWVVFSCGGERLGIPLLSSREVVPPQPLTRLPGCGPEVAGLVGLRGRVVTAFDMGVVIGAAPAQSVPDHRLLVLDYGERVVAIAVDAVVGIARAQGAALEPIGATALGHLESVRGDVIGVGFLEGKRYLALDPERILKRLLA